MLCNVVVSGAIALFVCVSLIVWAVFRGKASLVTNGVWQYCPVCAGKLQMGEIDGKQRLKCQRCAFVRWNNPIPVANILIPGKTADGRDGVVLIRRKREPRAGMLALPGGFGEPHEHPEDTAVNESLQETKLAIVLDRLLAVRVPPKVNQILLFYLAKPVDAAPSPGDDAEEAFVVALDEIPFDELAFSTHAEVLAAWVQQVKG